MNWSEELREWRESMGWSQVTASKRFGVPAQTYRNWEHHRVQKMPATARKLFEIFKSGNPSSPETSK